MFIERKFLSRALLASVVLSVSMFSVSAEAAWFKRFFKKDEYTKTKYPIVLVHGIAGAERYLGSIDYFYRVADQLERSGAKVYAPSVSAFHSSEVRGEQLARKVKHIIAITGARKVNLIGHSHGAPTSRYVASRYPHMVASVTSIGGVNWGTAGGDQLLAITSKIPYGHWGVGAFYTAFGKLVNLVAGERLPQNGLQSMKALSTKAALEFTKKYPEGMPSGYCRNNGVERASNGVRYYSWSGSAPVTNLFDPLDIPLGILGRVFFSREENDGLVSSCSSHLGKVIKDNYRMNHLDEVNQMLGIHSYREADPISVYRQHANRLKNKGL